MEIRSSFTNKPKKKYQDRHKDPKYFIKRYYRFREKILARKKQLSWIRKTGNPNITFSEIERIKRENRKARTLIATRNFTKFTVNRRTFIPILPKKKYPSKKGWNKKNYFYKGKLDHDDLPRGGLKIRHDDFRGYTIIWADIDQKGWTKIPQKYRCSYIKSPKGYIKFGFKVKDVIHKTGKLYFNGKPIGDFKSSGEIMLPNNDYWNSDGEYLGFYDFVNWGTFFANNNQVSSNTAEVCKQLRNDFNIQYVSMSEHYKLKKQLLAYKDLQAQVVQTIK